MKKVHFTETTEDQKKKIIGSKTLHRYWIVNKDTIADTGTPPWTRWWESSTKYKPNPFASTIIYVFDIIDNKVIYAPTNLRDIHIIGTRTWPLKETLLEVAVDRARAKKSRRTMARLEKTN